MAVTKAPQSSARHHRRAQAVRRRYIDGYRVANSVNGFGQFIKVGGLVLGLVVWAGVAQVAGSGAGGFVFGLIVAAIFFVIGVIVAAQGQLLKATLDTAVHSSPFLTNDARAAVMSLPGTGGSVDDVEFARPDAELLARVPDQGSAGEVQPGEPGDVPDESFCYHCGAETGPGATKCQSCGKPL